MNIYQSNTFSKLMSWTLLICADYHEHIKASEIIQAFRAYACRAKYSDVRQMWFEAMQNPREQVVSQRVLHILEDIDLYGSKSGQHKYN